MFFRRLNGKCQQIQPWSELCFPAAANGPAFGWFWCSLEEMVVFRGVMVCLDD